MLGGPSGDLQLVAPVILITLARTFVVNLCRIQGLRVVSCDCINAIHSQYAQGASRHFPLVMLGAGSRKLNKSGKQEYTTSSPNPITSKFVSLPYSRLTCLLAMSQ